MEDGEKAAGGDAFVEGKEAFVVEGEMLVVGMEFEALEALGGGFVRMRQGVGIIGMDGQQHFEAGVLLADVARPAADAVEMGGFGGDGADNGTVDARPVHGGDQRRRPAVGVGRAVALGLEERNGLGREGILEGVGMEVDEHENI